MVEKLIFPRRWVNEGKAAKWTGFVLQDLPHDKATDVSDNIFDEFGVGVEFWRIGKMFDDVETLLWFFSEIGTISRRIRTNSNVCQKTAKNVRKVFGCRVVVPTKSASDSIEEKFQVVLAELVGQDVSEGVWRVKKQFSADAQEGLDTKNESNKAGVVDWPDNG